MVSIGDIRKRQMCLNIKNTSRDSSVDLLIENCNKTKSVDVIESYFKNWPYSRKENCYEFTEAVNILESFSKRVNNASITNKAINLFSEMVLTKTVNMKTAKKVLESVSIDSSSLLEECNKYIVCDRILSNHDKLVKKGINDLMSNTGLLSESKIDDYVTVVCEFIDNIDMKFPTKYNVALENTLYLLDKRGVKYNRKSVLESINDYFFINLDEEKSSAMTIVLKESATYSDEDKKSIIIESAYTDLEKEDEELGIDLDLNDDGELEFSTESVADEVKNILTQLKALPKKTPEALKEFIKKLYTKSADNIIEETPNFLTWMRKFLIFGTIAISPYLTVISFFADLAMQAKLQRSETEKIVKSYKKEKEKSESKMANCTNEKEKEKLKQYIKELDKDIDKLEEYQDTLFSEKEIEQRNDEEMNESGELDIQNAITLKEYITIYHPKVTAQMYTLRSQLDEFLKSKYKKIYEAQCVLLNSIEELKSFEHANIDSILSYIGSDNKVYVDIAKFLGLRYNELNDTDINQEDVLSDICDTLQLDVDFDFCVMYDGEEDMYNIYLSYNKPILLADDSDTEIEEQVHISILKACAIINILSEQSSKISEKDVDYLLDFIDDNIDIFDMETVSCIGQFSVVASDIISPKVIANFFEESANLIREKESGNNKYVKLAKIQEGINGMKISKPRSTKYLGIYDTYTDNKLLQESMELLDQLTINETSVVNIMKMAQAKLKDNMQKLSDKDKSVSRQLDFAVDQMVQKMQRSVTNDNREAVIKGSLIPSASKALKIALVSGAAFAVAPAIAIIGVLGGIAASKHATDKERQYILDEIDVESKVVEKKIQLADRSDDMASMEELLKIQQKLRREKSRIQYKKKDYVPGRKE